MKFRFELKKKNYIVTAIAFVFMLGFCLYSGKTPLMAVLFSAIYFGIKGLNVELHPKLTYVWVLLELLVSAIFTALLIQTVLLTPDLRGKISTYRLFLNILCCVVVYLGALFLSARPKIAFSVSYICLMLFASVDYFVYQFRQNEFQFADLSSAGTGLSVASEYKFQMDTRVAMGIMLSILFVAAVRKVNLTIKRKYVLRLASLFAAVGCAIYIASNTNSINTETWEQKGTYRNGYLLNFVLGTRDSFVAKPKVYSLDTVKKLEKKYGTDATKNVSSNKKDSDAPVIIAIMDESFADLSVIGDLETNEPVTPYLQSMNENIIKGHALSSVFGAKTPNSEWEFLTGNTMAFLPSGSVVYQQYIPSNTISLVSTLESYGYKTVSMHDYYKTGWSRNKVYPLLGFDNSYFLDFFDQTKIARDYVTDQEIFDKIIEQYKNKKPDEKLFIHAVTMQNHGGYHDEYDNFNDNIVMTNGYYPDVNQYLSLTNMTDKALQNLIDYFQNVDQKVEIVFYGDHQPSLNSNFYRQLNGKGLSGLSMQELENLFTVPFFIWTNYPTDTQTVDYTSFNYLATMVTKRAGLELTPYQKFLDDMRQTIPAMNSRGYYSKEQGGFIHYNQATGKEKEFLNNYEVLQYNDMFDKNHKSKVFFPFYSDGKKDKIK